MIFRIIVLKKTNTNEILKILIQTIIKWFAGTQTTHRMTLSNSRHCEIVDMMFHKKQSIL